jgi:oligopeptide/dipeptide ABC transporter ATP-binding protein
MPYTKILLDAVPRLDLPPHSPLPVVSLRAPDMVNLAPGCAFAPRCPRRADDCTRQAPDLVEHEHDHLWACFHPEEPAGPGETAGTARPEGATARAQAAAEGRQ